MDNFDQYDWDAMDVNDLIHTIHEAVESFYATTTPTFIRGLGNDREGDIIFNLLELTGYEYTARPNFDLEDNEKRLDRFSREVNLREIYGTFLKV